MNPTSNSPQLDDAPRPVPRYTNGAYIGTFVIRCILCKRRDLQFMEFWTCLDTLINKTNKPTDI
jgi:hypothetical protein